MNILIIIGSVLIGLIIYFLPTFLSEYRDRIVTLDDVSPASIEVKDIESFLDAHKSDNVVLFVTPFYSNTNLASNREWVKEVVDLQKKYNFTLGLHGHSHKFIDKECGEFLFPNPLKIIKAREEFKNAFGYYPKFFRAPCFTFNIFDYIFIKFLGMKNLGYYDHGKTYHPYNLEKDWDTLHPSFLNSILNR